MNCCVDCLETYSTNITVPSETAIPLNSIAVRKGCDICKSGTTGIQFNKCGLYQIDISAFGTANEESESGDVIIQVKKDNIPIPNAIYTVTASTDDVSVCISGSCLVQIDRNNGCCACASPTIVTIDNQGMITDYSLIDVVVKRIQ